MIEIIVQTTYSGMYNDTWRFTHADEAARCMIDRERLGMINKVIQISGSGMELARYAMEVDKLTEDENELHKIVTAAMWNVIQSERDKP